MSCDRKTQLENTKNTFTFALNTQKWPRNSPSSNCYKNATSAQNDVALLIIHQNEHQLSCACTHYEQKNKYFFIVEYNVTVD